MKIALVRARYNPSGGAERFAERALHALRSQETSVSIIARSWVGTPIDGGPDTLVRCDPFYLGSVWRDWSFARAVRAAVEKARFDLVQSHERIPGLAIYRAGDGVHAAWLARRKVAATRLHQWGIGLNPHHWYLLKVERALFEHPDLRAVICNSRMVIKEIIDRFKVDARKLHLIPNGVDLEYFHPGLSAVHRSTTRAELGIGESVATLLFMGSGFERKGLTLALEALARMPAASHLIVVGDDKRRARYVRRAEQLGVARRVSFLGEVADPRPYLGAADVLVLPTLYDPFPNVVLEALASGLPVITSDACGAIDVIRPGTNGWIHRSGSRDDLVEKLSLWLTQLQETGGEPLVRAARASVEPYSIAALGAALVALYEKLLMSRAPRASDTG